MPSIRRIGVIAAVVLLAPLAASAQTIGTFRWQQQPFCNVITLNVVQDGTIFQLDGFDDQCGAPTRAAVSGLAFFNPDGTVGMGLTIVTTPGGAATHVDAAISVATVSGTWRDAAGATGPWAFQPGASSGGAPRPTPRPVFTQGLSAGGSTVTNVGVPTSAADAANKAYVDSADATVRTFAQALATTSVPVTASSAISLQGNAEPGGAGCMFQTTPPVQTIVRVDLPLPVGAVLQGLRVRYQNATTIPGGLTFRIQALSFATSSVNEVVRHTFSSDATGLRVQQSAIALEPVTSSRTYHLDVTMPVSPSSSGFCGVEVLFTRP